MKLLFCICIKYIATMGLIHCYNLKDTLLQWNEYIIVARQMPMEQVDWTCCCVLTSFYTADRVESEFKKCLQVKI